MKILGATHAKEDTRRTRFMKVYEIKTAFSG